MQSSTVALSMARLLDPGPMEGVLGYRGGAGALGAQKAPPAQRLEIKNYRTFYPERNG